MSSSELRAKRWPFVESPGEFAQRLHEAMHGPGGLLAGVRTVLIEEPPTLAPEYFAMLPRPGQEEVRALVERLQRDALGWMPTSTVSGPKTAELENEAASMLSRLNARIAELEAERAKL